MPMALSHGLWLRVCGLMHSPLAFAFLGRGAAGDPIIGRALNGRPPSFVHCMHVVAEFWGQAVHVTFGA